jgi:hypothetical protein
MQIFLKGAPTLKRFTDGILRKGVERSGYKVCSDFSGGEFGIIQIHGSPAAREADLEIIRDIPQIVHHLAGSIVLLHRPDEIRDAIPNLRYVLCSLPPKVGVVMLGDLLINDPFYRIPNLERRVIPHGFFELDYADSSLPVILGSHTSWGEMRSVQGVITLLKAVSEIGSLNPVAGYLGGIPEEVLSFDSVSTILERKSLTSRFTLCEFDRTNWREQLASVSTHTLFLNPGTASSGFDVTFNVQMYHYGTQVRFGESSGSLHSSNGIPVIFEMNGSDRIENLKAVKVPYSDSSDVSSADFESAALQIATLVRSGEYKSWLNHNREMAKVWSCNTVGKLYVEFLNSLATKC